MFCCIYIFAILLKIAVYLAQGLIFIAIKLCKLLFAAIKFSWELIQLIAVGIACLFFKIKDAIEDKRDAKKYAKRMAA